jgi:23S rRNA-/tRNA-specific pseudouridylate synthase
MAVVRNPDKIPSSDQFAALTEWTPIETGQDFSLLDVVIFTGVTHQIRCHLAAAGHPIAGDALYGSTLDAPRHWLHACPHHPHPPRHRQIPRPLLPPAPRLAATR